MFSRPLPGLLKTAATSAALQSSSTLGHTQNYCSTSPRCAHSNNSRDAWRLGVPSSRRASDLLALRGVGPVNAKLLLANGITSVDKLQQLYCRHMSKDRIELMRFLSSVVGFRNGAHCRSVADHLDDMEWNPHSKPIKLAVEGNIGAGKSTFLDIMQSSTLELRDLIQVIPEPVEEWQNVKNGCAEPINLLDRFYKDPKRYAYMFQHYVLLTRMEKERKSRSSSKPIRILERSIFSDRLVFVRAMHEAGYMGDLELQLYDSWFSMEISHDRQLAPYGFIYLKAQPETCIKRLRARNRSEESGVDHAYLENLHDKHESWLNQGFTTHKTMATFQADHNTKRETSSVQSSQPIFDRLKAAPASIRENISFLGVHRNSAGKNHNHHSGEDNVLEMLFGVPTLVLDHEQEDILFDADARQDYATKVKDFSEFVASLQPTPRLTESVSPAPSGVNLTPEQLISLKHLVHDYRRLLRDQKEKSVLAESNLLAIEGNLDKLMLDSHLVVDG